MFVRSFQPSQRSQSTISKHLNILHEAGIPDRSIEGKRGKQTPYRIKDHHVFDLLKAADVLVLD
jgi:predicted DNA-binding transcriptional regulator YafY